MTNTERRIRIDIAIEVVEGVYSDLCRESTAQISREQTYELANIILQLRTYSEKIGYLEAMS